MPRTGRGGRRQGTPGETYEQRTDLNENRQPVRVASGGAYGERKATEDAQRIASVPDARAATAPDPAAGGGPAAPWTPPALVPLSAPTQYPDRPLTNGLSTGPGAGPEALGQPAGPDLERYRPLLPVLELAVSRQGVSAETRNFVRRLRGALGTSGTPMLGR